MKKYIVLSLILVILSMSVCLLANKAKPVTTFDFSVYPEEIEERANIDVIVAEQMEVTVAILDLNDVVLKVVYSGVLPQGNSKFSWDGTDFKGTRLKSGKYQVELSTTTRYTSVKKIIILK